MQNGPQLKAAFLAAFLALTTPALALNPQPEPPRPYHGYSYVLTHTGPNAWHWEIHGGSSGGVHPSPVLSEGSVRGARASAVRDARKAIDQLGTPH